MTTTEQNVTIAKEQGWKLREPSMHWIHPSFPGVLFNEVPAYSENSDAINYVLDFMDDDNWMEYLLTLCAVARINTEGSKWFLMRRLLRTTAAQRTEAYCRLMWPERFSSKELPPSV